MDAADAFAAGLEFLAKPSPHHALRERLRSKVKRRFVVNSPVTNSVTNPGPADPFSDARDALGSGIRKPSDSSYRS